MQWAIGLDSVGDFRGSMENEPSDCPLSPKGECLPTGSDLSLVEGSPTG